MDDSGFVDIYREDKPNLKMSELRRYQAFAMIQSIPLLVLDSRFTLHDGHQSQSLVAQPGEQPV